jgi:hypothetical protein
LEISVFPNPGADYVMIHGAAGRHILVHDALGRLTIDEILAPSGTRRLDTSDWPAGVYTVTSPAGGERMVKKLLIEH